MKLLPHETAALRNLIISNAALRAVLALIEKARGVAELREDVERVEGFLRGGSK